METNSEVLNSLNLDFTMGHFLKVERELRKNILFSEKVEEYDDAIKALNAYIVSDVRPFMSAVEGKELNDKEEARQLEISTTFRNMSDEAELIHLEILFDKLAIVAKEDISNLEITKDDLLKFGKIYVQKTRTLMGSASENGEKDDDKKK